MIKNHSHTAPELTEAGAVWIRSTYSDGSGNNCVEAAVVSSGVGVRDSKDEFGPALVVTPEAWASFVRFVSSGAANLGVVDCA